MKQQSVGRIVGYGSGASFCVYATVAAAYGLLAPAMVLWLTVGLCWVWRAGFLPRPPWRPADILGLGALVLFWPVGVYVDVVHTSGR
jgi:hypothetical protein